MAKKLFEDNADWDFPTLEKTWEQIEIIAKEELEMDYFTPQIEIVSAEQMIDAYTSIGLPINYTHWSFGKDYITTTDQYKKGMTNLALELIINSNPSIAYCMEDNDMLEQALVMAHASVGHSHFFKNNYLFVENTEPEAIVTYLDFARKYIAKCEERYGIDEVELVLDACHALKNYGIDKYKKKHKKKLSEEQKELEAKLQHEEDLKNYDDLFKKTIPEKATENKEEKINPQENLLYFLEKKAPRLPQWKREIIRIVRKIATYFSGQGLTKVSNEGTASFVHHYIMTRMQEKGLIGDGSFQAFMRSHTNIIMQPTYTSRWYNGTFNPYALGFSIYTDIKRICQDPTEEDKQWFPHLVGQRWQDAIKYAAANYNDSSFIQQYLSPKLIRDYKLFNVKFKQNEAIVMDIHDDVGYKEVRNKLAETYQRVNYVPDIQVIDASFLGDRTLTLEYKPYNGREIYMPWASKTMQYIKTLWGFKVNLVQALPNGEPKKLLLSLS